MHKLTKIHTGLVAIALTCAGVASLWFGAQALFEGTETRALAGLGAGLLLLFASMIDRFESLKGFGVEAKTKLDQKIHEADEVLATVREVTALMGSSLIELHTGVSDGEPQQRIIDGYEMAQKIKALMLKTGSDQKTVRKSLTPWSVAAAHALFGHFATPLHNKLRMHQDQIRSRPLSDSSGQETRDKAIADLQNFMGFDRRPMSQCTIADYISRLDHMSHAPYLEDSYRKTLQETMTKACDELRYLDEQLDFRDLDFWLRLPRL